MNKCTANRVGSRSCLWMLLTVLLLTACKPSVPDTYLQPGEMADILFDCHLAEAIVNQQPTDDKLAPLAFKESIMRKHGTTIAEFDSSMVYYSRHASQLHDVYVMLSDRLSDEAMAQGTTAGELNKYGNLSSSADTANVWNGDRVLVMSPYPSFNNYSFELEADTAFHKGDKLLLDFDTQFIYQDGVRDAIAVLVVKFTNDSIASQSIRMSSSSRYHLQVGGDSLQMKNIRGYFMLNRKSTEESATTLKMLVVSNISLVRMHNKPAEPAAKTDESATKQDGEKASGPADSAKVSSGRPTGIVPTDKKLQKLP